MMKVPPDMLIIIVSEFFILQSNCFRGSTLSILSLVAFFGVNSPFLFPGLPIFFCDYYGDREFRLPNYDFDIVS